MNVPPKHSRSASKGPAEGFYWATRASSVGMQMAVPAGLGFLADRHFQTSPWWTVVGVCLGFVLAMWELFRLAGGESGSARPPTSPRGRGSQRGSTQSSDH